MSYLKPEVVDLGDLISLTQAGAIGNAEDGTGKFVFVDTPPAQVSVVIIP